MKKILQKKGFALIEVFLAITIFAIFATGIFYLSLDTLQRDTKINLNTEALLYTQEGIEAVRNIRDKNYLFLENGDKGLDLTAGSWSFTTAPEDVDGFYERVITIEDVYRDENGDIDESGIYLDVYTKKVTSEVSWLQKGIIPRSTALTTYMTDWRGDEWIETTCTEFNAGTLDGTETFLEAIPPADNCGIKLETVEATGDVTSYANTGKHGTDVVVDGDYAYVATENNQTGLYIVDISDPENPSIADTVDIGEKGKYLTKINNDVYVSTQSSSYGMANVDVSNPQNAFVDFSFDNEEQMNEPEVSGDYLYIAIDDSENSFMVYDISAGVLPNPQLIDTYEFESNAFIVEIHNNYAYVGLDDDNDGLRIMNISDPYNLQEVAIVNVGEEVNAIIISGFVAYVGTENPNDSLQVINISDPENPVIVTSIDVGGEIQDITVSGDYLYAAIDESQAGLAAIDVSNPISPSLVYNMDIEGKGTGIDSDSQYVYITTDTSNKGLVIVGQIISGAVESGTLTSQIFDTGSTDTRYNFIEWDHTEVPGGDVKVQIRTADSVANIGSATWVGSDGTNSTYYENSRTVIELDPGRSGARYFQYKIFLESDGANSPAVESIKINYSP